MSANAAPVHRARPDVSADMAQMKETLLSAFAELEGMFAAARLDPSRQQALVELVDCLTAKRRALSEEEELMCDGLVGVAQAAELLGIGESLVRNMIASGELRIVKIGGRTLLPRRLLLKFAADRLSEPRVRSAR